MNKVCLFLFICLFFGACETSTTSNNQVTSPPTTNQPEPTKKTIAPITPATGSADTTQPTKSSVAANLPTTHDCKVKSGTAMEDNELFVPAQQVWMTIVADSITKDMDFGDSYRIFDVYNTANCEQIGREILPVNNSPDFPWYIMPETYDAKNQVVCMPGFEFTYCYDVVDKKMIPRAKPAYLLKRQSLDAQSGMPLGMAVYGNYLFGYAQDMGAFCFDLKDKSKLRPLLPAAEYKNKAKNQYAGLFLLPEGNGKFQAVIPVMDIDNAKLEVKPLLKNSVSLNPVIAKNVQDNRFQVLKNLDNQKGIAFDLEKQERIEIPDAIASTGIGKILEYIKKR